MRKTRGPRQPFLKGSLKEYTHTHSRSPLAVCGHCLISIHCLFGCLNAQVSVTELSQPQCVPPPHFCSLSFVWGSRERDGSRVFFISLFAVDLGSVCASLSHRAPIWFVNSFVGFFFFFLLRICTHVTSMKLERGERMGEKPVFFYMPLLEQLWQNDHIVMLENFQHANK